MIYKTNDGWDLENIPPLQEVVDEYDEMAVLIYELKNCVRTMSLIEMRDKLMDHLSIIEGALSEIGDNDKVEEEEDE